MPESRFIAFRAENARPAAGETVREAFPAACSTSADPPQEAVKYKMQGEPGKRANAVVHVQAGLDYGPQSGAAVASSGTARYMPVTRVNFVSVSWPPKPTVGSY